MAILTKFSFIFFTKFCVKSFISSIKIVIFVLAISLIAQSQSKAALMVGQSILLDFGNQGTVGGVAPPTNSNFIDSANTRTSLTEFISGNSVTVGLTQSSGPDTINHFFNDDVGDLDGPNNNTGSAGFVIPAPFNSAITEDWAGVVNGDSYDITFTGLDDSLTYNIDYIVGGFSNNTVTENLELHAGGQSTSIVASDGTTGISVDPRTASLTGLTTDGSGNLVIQIVEPQVTGATEVAVISGLFLQAIPEPSTALLTSLIVFAATFLRYRRPLLN